eukprot:TRINITY_DN1140_c0_g1_i2.p1 TRINITY_DN1140_c0_g1~~TRINITY_DN1140_c0_g1_i2.p1  ORF type:complete len:268 (+),score=45.88 TRINITY_DN1140_c0_g1_i2:303-1106(+)
MADLLAESDEIKRTINNLKTAIRTLEDKQKQSLYAITPDQTSRANADIKQYTTTIAQGINDVKAQLDQMAQNNLRNMGAPDSHMRSNILESLKGKFAEVIRQYSTVQTDYKDKVKQRLAQKYKIVKPEATAEEIDEAIEEGTVDKVFQMQLMDQAGLTTQAKNALSYIQDRHRDIVVLESSIRELNQLFNDMAVLVESQGAILDTVEKDVYSAVGDTEAGTRNLREAIAQQKKSRTKMIVLAVVLIIVVIIILASSITAALKKKTDA